MISDAGHRARLGVGLRAGLGRLVLGPGGERYSFMPWLAGTACHCTLAVTGRRAGFERGRCCCPSAPSRFRCWAHLLLVRSGVLVSVHAFASTGARDNLALWWQRSPRRLAAAVRRARAQGAFAGEHAVVARVAAVSSNVLLMAAMLVVLLGTLRRWCTNSWGGAFPVGSRSLTCSHG
ncbi:hypothetical protein KCP74_05705 [Salmonella enterica subsp. enterica]|nr:hypothetical protein KCP74_05705 [Salmonella enterica subsp. enterica]